MADDLLGGTVSRPGSQRGGLIMEWKPIAHIHSPFPEKFGVPRQSGLIDSLRAWVVFEPECRVREAFRGLEEFSHLWLIWLFSQVPEGKWSPTVRPPRLGGNRRVGVFASRSPFRPNPIGLSCVALEKVELEGPDGPRLLVRGADLMDGTPIYDVKPYLPQADCHPEASGGFTDRNPWTALKVDFPPALEKAIPPELLEALRQVLAADPRPHYHSDPKRVYGMGFGGIQVRFTVEDSVLHVVSVEARKDP